MLKIALTVAGTLGAVPIGSFYARTLRWHHAVGGDVAAGALLLIGLFAGTMAMSVAAGQVRPSPLRWLLAALLAVSCGFVTVVAISAGAPPTLDLVAMSLDSAGALPEFVRFNPVAVAAGLLCGLATLVGVGLAPSGRRQGSLASALVAGGLALLILLAGSGRGWAVGAATPAWSGVTLAALTLLGGAQGTLDAAPPPALRPARAAPLGDVVLIVDESVGGHYLDLNRPGGVPSGLRPAPAGVEIANFGIAASATNFSVGSNYILRTGGTRERYLRRRASIWAYAHRAGYRTVHIFAQASPGLQNLMTSAERQEIDQYIRLDTVPLPDRDHAAARIVHALLHDGRPEFVMINKVGVHYPAWQSYPPAQSVYRPSLATDARLHGNVSARTAGDWARYRNDYRNGVRWSVAGFFRILLAGGLPAGAAIVYTSDHGEAMQERGLVARLPHGAIDHPLPEEGAVPLVVLTSAAPPDPRWRATAASARGASHYRIFPSLLALFGYDRRQVAPLFGPDLLSPIPDPMTFNSHFYTRATTRAAWTRVDDAALPDPTR